MDDWRRDNDTDIMSTPLDMTTLISRLHRSPGDQHHDVSFRLPDGSEVGGHKLVLAVASPVFESQFYGPMAAENTDVVTVKEVDSKAFRLLLECVYNSGPVESWDLTPDDYWNLFNAAHLYIVPVLMMHCEVKLSEHAETLKNDANKLIEFINKAQTLSISEKLSKIGLDLIKKNLHKYYKSDSESLNKLELKAMKEVVKYIFAEVTEGEMFDIAVKWSKANTENEEEAKNIFEDKFLDKFDVKRISPNMFVKFIGPSDFLPTAVYKEWSMEVMKNDVAGGTRQDFNDLSRQLRVEVKMCSRNEKHYRMRKVQTFRKVLEAAAKAFNVPLRFAEFKLARSNIRVTSDNYFEDFRESLCPIQFRQNYIELILQDNAVVANVELVVHEVEDDNVIMPAIENEMNNFMMELQQELEQEQQAPFF